MHYPAKESLQEFAQRKQLTIEEAYPIWHDRHYPEIVCTELWGSARGPGLGFPDDDPAHPKRGLAARMAGARVG